VAQYRNSLLRESVYNYKYIIEPVLIYRR